MSARLPKWASEAARSGEELAALELLGLLEEIAYHLGIEPSQGFTFAQPYSTEEDFPDRPALVRARPFVEIVAEVARRAETLPGYPEEPGDLAEILTTLGILAEEIAAAEEERETFSTLTASLHRIIESEAL